MEAVEILLLKEAKTVKLLRESAFRWLYQMSSLSVAG